MPLKTIVEVSSENFDLYFAKEIEKLTPQAKESLPRDIVFKLFRKGGAFNSNSTSKLSFLTKLYVLWRALNKRWWIVIEDEDRGMTPGQFMELRRLYKRKEYGVDQARDISLAGTLVLGAKEMGESMAYANRLSASPAYNYLMKAKNNPKNPAAEADKQVQYIAKFLVHWESGKKTLVSRTGMGIPEVFVLLALYHGREVAGATLYHEVYKRAYQSSPAKIKTAFRILQQRGYINKMGVTSNSTLQITATGKDVLRDLLDKYAINC